jgi:septum formation protein
MYNKIYLASKSPRRRDLLKQINVEFELIDGNVDESILPGEKGFDYCLRMAREKVQKGWKNADRKEPRPVLAADTIVLLDNEILTKPQNENDAFEMLTKIQGRTHQVITAVALKANETIINSINTTQVSFAVMSEEDITEYIASGESLGRAGAYSIQGRIAKFIKSINGSYTGVVGLPLHETYQLLQNY